MLRAADLEYELPPELIATEPVSPRDSARLMIVDRRDPSKVSHARVRDLRSILGAQDVLVFNTTRVLQARFFGKRKGTGGKVEGLYLHAAPQGTRSENAVGVWCALLRGRHLRPGAEIELFDRAGTRSGYTLSINGRYEPGAWTVELRGPPAATPAVLEQIGHTPLPPYIVKARQRAAQAGEVDDDRERYQTVYADAPGSVAAPTAGLHFTPELLASLSERGIGRIDTLLHVGAGTFKPIEAELVEDHPMHAEWCSMSAGAVEAVLRARRTGKRIIAVGTTAARTLESHAEVVEQHGAGPPSLETRLLVTPGYRFRWVDGMLTNFHLPRSTLMAMVAAMLPGDGVGHLKALYARAIENRYRFYSYGDAMLIA